MPHQCVKCSEKYDDDSIVINGCICGSKAFFFMRSGTVEISNEAREQIMDASHAGPVILDVENIRIHDGKYDLDLNAIFGKKEIIYQYDDGKYSVDLEESFRRHSQK